jgi:hypothetical protein
MAMYTMGLALLTNSTVKSSLYYGNALYAASEGGHEKVVQILLDEGANVNAKEETKWQCTTSSIRG